MIEDKLNLPFNAPVTPFPDVRSQGSSVRTDVQGRPVHNHLLSLISDRDFAVVQPHLEFVSLQVQQVLLEPGDKIEYVVLLNSGLVSLLVVTSDARSVEVGMVGRDGCVGAALAAGVRQSSQRALGADSRRRRFALSPRHSSAS